MKIHRSLKKLEVKKNRTKEELLSRLIWIGLPLQKETWKLVNMLKVWAEMTKLNLNSMSKWDKVSPIPSLVNLTAMLNFSLLTMMMKFVSFLNQQLLVSHLNRLIVKLTTDQVWTKLKIDSILLTTPTQELRAPMVWWSMQSSKGHQRLLKAKRDKERKELLQVSTCQMMIKTTKALKYMTNKRIISFEKKDKFKSK